MRTSDNACHAKKNCTENLARSLKTLYTNADSLPNKMAELEITVDRENPNIFMIVEVIPKSSRVRTTEASISLWGCNMFTYLGKDGLWGIAFLHKK